MTARKVLVGRTLGGEEFSVDFDPAQPQQTALKWRGPFLQQGFDVKTRRVLTQVAELTLFRTNGDQSPFAKFCFVPKGGKTKLDTARDNFVEVLVDPPPSTPGFVARLTIAGWLRSFIGDNGEGLDPDDDGAPSVPDGQVLAYPIQLELRAFADGKKQPQFCVSLATIGDTRISNSKLDARCPIEELVQLSGAQSGARDPLRQLLTTKKGKLVDEELEGEVDAAGRPLACLAKLLGSGDVNSAVELHRTRLEFRPIESNRSLMALAPTRVIELQDEELRVGGAPVRLGRGERVELRQRQLDESAERYALTVELEARQFAGCWNATVAQPHHRALSSLRDAHRLSLAPELIALSADQATVAQWRTELRETATRRRVLAAKDFELRPLADAPSNIVPLQTSCLQPVETHESGASFDGIALDVRFPGFLTHAGAPLELRMTAHRTAAASEVTGSSEIRFELRAAPASGLDPQSVRLGALDFHFSALAPLDASTQSPTLECRARVRDNSAATQPIWDLHCAGVLAVDNVAPGGQDRSPGDRREEAGGGADRLEREQPIVIVTEPPDAASSGPRFLLKVTERTEKTRSHSVVLNLLLDPRSEDVQGLLAAGAAGSGRSIVVIDREPFLVARLESPNFTGGSSARETPEIGNWSSDDEIGGERWELLTGADRALVTLPPQGIGETTLRGRELAPPTGAGPLPFVFTPAATVELETNEFGQSFIEPAWNLRRLLGYAGQRAPGARLRRAQFELLYGMRCEVAAPSLRLAELAARIGRLAPSFESAQTSVADEQLRSFRRRWNELLASYQARLAILEPWDERQRGTLRLEEGVQFELRVGEAANPTVEPVPEGKLRGGALWGYDSPGAYQDRLQRPSSTSAVLTRPWFSALGGAGHQKAVFDHGLTTIYSDTTLGRTSYYCLEQLGRIGVLWNLAKLVSVYERSVVPTQQFEAGQTAHLGRPVLRLVAKYVEILEPKRDFPDNSAEPITRGFVKGVRFRSSIIPVGEGAGWQEDVQGGAITRLWNRSADSQIYPKPHIDLVLAADPSGAADTVATTLDDPSQLVFFARFGGDLPDVRDWPPVAGVDFAANAAPPAPTETEEFRASNPDADLHDALEAPANFERFTFKLAVAERPANLVAERTANALSAALANVTLVRTQAQSTLSLLRAFGDAPRTPGLEFNRKRVGYYFDEARRAVDITPLTALVHRADDALKPFSLRIPTRQLLERVIPDQLERFELSTIIPDLGGIRFKSLFPGLRLPALANRNVRVSQGLDPQTRRPWLKADIDVPLAGQNTMFSLGPIALVMRNMSLFAMARVQSDRGGGARQTVRGRLRGDLDLVVGGMTLLTFSETALEFDDSGQVRIDLAPSRAKLHGFLGVITDLIAVVSVNPGKLAEKLAEDSDGAKDRDKDDDPKSKDKKKSKGEAGFELNVLYDQLASGIAVPSGVEAVLTYELPDIAVGAFTLTNVVLSAAFSLEVELANLEFWLGVQFGVGAKDSPFTLTVLCLGGGGWVTAGVRYAPLSQRTQVEVSVGIAAAASLEFALGPIKGGISAYLGVFVNYSTDSAEGSRLVIGVMFMVKGEVDVLGLISISLSLLLEATYERTASESVIVARGALSLEIEICFFLTIELEVSVEYRFAAPGGASRQVAAPAAAAQLDPVDQYVDMLE